MSVNENMIGVVRNMMNLTELFHIRKFAYEEATAYVDGKTVKTGKSTLTLVLEVDNDTPHVGGAVKKA